MERIGLECVCVIGERYVFIFTAITELMFMHNNVCMHERFIPTVVIVDSLTDASYYTHFRENDRDRRYRREISQLVSISRKSRSFFR